MISRIWHGYTDFKNANAYENLLKHEIFTGIKNRRIPGYKGIQLLRRDLDKEVEFVTIMWFDSLEAVKVFAVKIMKQRLSQMLPGIAFTIRYKIAAL
jgi:antibiotic biosynthesis monooxygenase (ABM) superfamily enzyme